MVKFVMPFSFLDRLPGVGRIPGSRLTRSMFLIVAASVLFAGCATKTIPQERPFAYPSDTFAYANELERHYGYKEDGEWGSWKKEPRPDYTLHCFVVARSAKQFFQHARFAPELPQADEKTYRKLVRDVVKTSARTTFPPADKVVIPGYANLREFSTDHEDLLKKECGGAWLSYIQRGNWRMVFPFSRGNQEKEALRLLDKIRQNNAPVVHIVRFPSLAVNHALLLFNANETEDAITYDVYDPNTPDSPTLLTYDKRKKTFRLPRNDYFIGGELDVYEVYSSVFK